jgi:tetratricopeptide (TPR) repeat protein
LGTAGAMFSRVDDEAGQALVLHLQGTLASQQGQYVAARTAYEQSLQIRERLDDKAGIGSLLSNLALVAENEGDIERAQTMNERALAIREEVGDKWAICVSQNNLGMIALIRRDFAEAQMRFENSMRLAAEVGDRWVIAVGHHNLGNALLGLGELELAGDEHLQALQAYEDYGDTWSIALLIEDVIPLAVAKRQFVHALELLGAADALRDRLEAPRPPTVEELLEVALVPARFELGVDTDGAQQRGRRHDAAAVASLLRVVGRSATSEAMNVG